MTSSPVAALTSGGPPMKIVPVPLTITVSSLIAGTYAPPAVHEPMTTAICAMPARRQVGLVVEDPPEVLAIGKHVGLQRQERAARVDQVDARQAVLGGDLLQAQVLLDRHRVVRAALDGRVVGDDRDLAARRPTPMPVTMPGRRAPRRRTCPRRRAATARGTACRDRRRRSMRSRASSLPRPGVPRDGLVAAAALDEREPLAQLRDERAGWRPRLASKAAVRGVPARTVIGAISIGHPPRVKRGRRVGGPTVRRARPRAAVGSRPPGGGAAPAGWR